MDKTKKKMISMLVVFPKEESRDFFYSDIHWWIKSTQSEIHVCIQEKKLHKLIFKEDESGFLFYISPSKEFAFSKLSSNPSQLPEKSFYNQFSEKLAKSYEWMSDVPISESMNFLSLEPSSPFSFENVWRTIQKKSKSSPKKERSLSKKNHVKKTKSSSLTMSIEKEIPMIMSSDVNETIESQLFQYLSSNKQRAETFCIEIVTASSFERIFSRYHPTYSLESEEYDYIHGIRGIKIDKNTKERRFICTFKNQMRPNESSFSKEIVDNHKMSLIVWSFVHQYCFKLKQLPPLISKSLILSTTLSINELENEKKIIVTEDFLLNVYKNDQYPKKTEDVSVLFEMYPGAKFHPQVLETYCLMKKCFHFQK